VRTVLFWLHLSAGVAAGVVILVMSATGVLLTYERQLTAWAERGYRSGPPEPGAGPLGTEALLVAVLRQRPGAELDSVTWHSDPEAPVELRLGRTPLFVNPYTGDVLGEGSGTVRRAFRTLTDWHRWLGASGEGREIGRAVTGACNLAFLFLVMTGVYIWWPRPFGLRRLRSVAVVDTTLKGKARDFNWHNSIGIWMALPLAAVVASGAVISYPWARDLIYTLTGSEPPPRRDAGRPAEGRRAAEAGGNQGSGPAGRRTEDGPGDLAGLDDARGRAAAASQGWRSIRVRLPLPDGPAVAFSVDRGSGTRPDLRSQISVDRRAGEIVSVRGFEDESPGRRLQSWLRWVHTGEAGGVLGQTLAGVASAGAAVLVWTGLALSWRRFFRRAQPRG
jgi:uncharacterized iron-regulated membrane protein